MAEAAATAPSSIGQPALFQKHFAEPTNAQPSGVVLPAGVQFAGAADRNKEDVGEAVKRHCGRSQPTTLHGTARHGTARKHRWQSKRDPSAALDDERRSDSLILTLFALVVRRSSVLLCLCSAWFDQARLVLSRSPVAPVSMCRISPPFCHTAHSSRATSLKTASSGEAQTETKRDDPRHARTSAGASAHRTCTVVTTCCVVLARSSPPPCPCVRMCVCHCVRLACQHRLSQPRATERAATHSNRLAPG